MSPFLYFFISKWTLGGILSEAPHLAVPSRGTWQHYAIPPRYQHHIGLQSLNPLHPLHFLCHLLLIHVPLAVPCKGSAVGTQPQENVWWARRAVLTHPSLTYVPSCSFAGSRPIDTIHLVLWIKDLIPSCLSVPWKLLTKASIPAQPYAWPVHLAGVLYITTAAMMCSCCYKYPRVAYVFTKGVSTLQLSLERDKVHQTSLSEPSGS